MEIRAYTSDSCFYCTQLKELFKRADVEWTEIKVVPNHEGEAEEGTIMRQDLASQYPMIDSFPAVFINEELVGGLVPTAKYLIKEGLVSAPN